MNIVHHLNILYFDAIAIQDDKQTNKYNSFCFLTCLEYFEQGFPHLSFFRSVARDLENSTSSERFSSLRESFFRHFVRMMYFCDHVIPRSVLFLPCLLVCLFAPTLTFAITFLILKIATSIWHACASYGAAHFEW